MKLIAHEPAFQSTAKSTPREFHRSKIPQNFGEPIQRHCLNYFGLDHEAPLKLRIPSQSVFYKTMAEDVAETARIQTCLVREFVCVCVCVCVIVQFVRSVVCRVATNLGGVDDNAAAPVEIKAHGRLTPTRSCIQYDIKICT